jgi:hypothetical protein
VLAILFLVLEVFDSRRRSLLLRRLFFALNRRADRLSGCGNPRSVCISHTKPAQTLHLAFQAAALQTSDSSATSIHSPQACLNFGTVVVRSVADTGNQSAANLAALKTIQSLTDLVEADWRSGVPRTMTPEENGSLCHILRCIDVAESCIVGESHFNAMLPFQPVVKRPTLIYHYSTGRPILQTSIRVTLPLSLQGVPWPPVAGALRFSTFIGNMGA